MPRSTPPPRPGPRALLALLGICLAGSAALTYLAVSDDADGPVAVVEQQSGPFRGDPLPPELAGAPAPTFSHADARGGRTGTADLAGQPYVVTFLYTQCPDVCPLIAQELREALELLGPRASEVAVLAVSVDPEGDDRAAVRSWLDRHELPRGFHYLLGSERELRPTWDAYFAAPQSSPASKSTHTASIWLVDSEGRLRTKFSGGTPVAPADIAHDLRLLLEDAERRGRAVSEASWAVARHR